MADVPLLSGPTVVNVADKATSKAGQKRHAVNFRLEWIISGGSYLQQITVGNFTFQGQKYTFSPFALGQTQIGDIKAMQFSQSYYAAPSASGHLSFPGPDLFVWSPSALQLVRLAPPIYANNSATGTLDPAFLTMAGCIPILGTQQSEITFAINGGPAAQTYLDVTLFDFELPAWTTQGITSIPEV